MEEDIKTLKLRIKYYEQNEERHLKERALFQDKVKEIEESLSQIYNSHRFSGRISKIGQIFGMVSALYFLYFGFSLISESLMSAVIYYVFFAGVMYLFYFENSFNNLVESKKNDLIKLLKSYLF